MKVRIRKYDSKDAYNSNVEHSSEEIKGSISEALDYCKGIISENKNNADFIGFRIETMKGY